MSLSTFELHKGQDYSRWKAPKAEAVNSRELIVESLIQSGRHLYLDPTLKDKVGIREIPISEGNLTVVDAVRASTLIEVDAKSAPQIESIVKQASVYAQAIVENMSFPAGVAVIQGDPTLPTMYKAQRKGTGSDPELTLFFASDQMIDPQSTDMLRNLIIVNGFSRKDGLSRIESKLELIGYDPAQKNGKSGRGRR